MNITRSARQSRLCNSPIILPSVSEVSLPATVGKEQLCPQLWVKTAGGLHIPLTSPSAYLASWTLQDNQVHSLQLSWKGLDCALQLIGSDMQPLQEPESDSGPNNREQILDIPDSLFDYCTIDTWMLHLCCTSTSGTSHGR